MAGSAAHGSDVTQGRSTSLMNLAQRYRKAWRPWLLPELSTQLAGTAAETAGGRVMCSTSNDALWCIRNGWKNLVLTELPADISTAERITEICRLADVIVAVDHFYHAELLSRAASRKQQQIFIAILTDLTEDSAGVRPGYDAQRLAQAAERLSGIRVLGLMAELNRAAHIGQLVEQVDEDKIRDSLNVLNHTCDLLRRISIPCSVVSVSSDHHPELILSHPVVTELRCAVQPWPNELIDPVVIENLSAPTDDDIHMANASLISRRDSTTIQTSFSIEAAVISRPNLQRAVVLMGIRHWHRQPGWERIRWRQLPMSRIQVTSISGAAIRSIGLDTTVLQLSGPALDLTIGERVTVTVHCRGIEPPAL